MVRNAVKYRVRPRVRFTSKNLLHHVVVLCDFNLRILPLEPHRELRIELAVCSGLN